MLRPLRVAALALLAAVSAAAQTAVPPAFQPVLARHGLDARSLRARGFLLDETGRCFQAGADGAPAGRALSPDDLELRLSGGGRVARAIEGGASSEPGASPSVSLPRAAPAFDGGGAGAPEAAVADAGVGAAQRPRAAPEAPFEPSLDRARRDLAEPRRRAAALRRLEGRFAKDDASPTGLSPGAPEALRLLAESLHEGHGGTGAAELLRRALARVAALEPEQKEAFAGRLTSPLTVYVVLSRSHAPHALESRLYFKRMTELLDGQGLRLTEFIRDEDPRGTYAAAFLLRAHAYDALIPYLNGRPSEAAALADFLFPDASSSSVRERASRLEGLMTQLAAQGRRSGALDAFVNGLEARAAAAEPGAALRAAVYLKVNEPLLPKRLRPGVDALAARLPPGLLDDAGLAPSDPHADWPADHWRFTMHFASTSSYRSFLRSFLALGYRRETSPSGLEVSKQFGALTVTVHATLYPGDKEGFLRGAAARRFLAGVERDLRDPNVQGVILRNHAQFRIVNLFGKGVTRGKLLLDGACRSAWDLQALRRKCPTCRFVLNTGTGYGAVNSEAAVEVIEGLARGDDWEQIGEAWSALNPRSSARMQGPWTPPLGEALKLLDRRESSSARGAGR